MPTVERLRGLARQLGGASQLCAGPSPAAAFDEQPLGPAEASQPILFNDRQMMDFVREGYVPLLSETVAAAQGADGTQGAEESTALALLSSWVDDTLRELQCGRRLPPPDEASMPDFKEPDDTNDARGGDYW